MSATRGPSGTVLYGGGTGTADADRDEDPREVADRIPRPGPQPFGARPVGGPRQPQPHQSGS